MKIIGVIPARYESSRFQGKPLADICGKPMIWWVYQHASQVKLFNELYVATDDQRIFDACEKFNMKCIMTSIYVNIQGDEPLMEPEVMEKAILPFLDNPDLQVSNLMTKIKDPVDVVNFTVPKVITNKEGIGIYLTRSTAPYPKGSISYDYYKQVCVYGFTPAALKFYCDYGKKYGKAKIESIEDIEILRFIENGYKVQFIEVDSETVAVDTPNDLKKVNEIMSAKLG